MRKRRYLKVKKMIKRDMRLLKYFSKSNNKDLYPTCEFGLKMAKKNLENLNDNYRRK